MSKASDRAYGAIRAEILSGGFRPGDPLREEALAETCGVSRTPVREAMRRLESEHLIRRTGARSFVASLSLDEVEESFALRAMLEGHAAARAAERVGAGAIATLNRINEAARAAVAAETPDVDQFIRENRAFHATILEAGSSDRTRALLATIVEQPVVLRTARRYGREQLARSVAEHDQLLEAFRRRDPEWARNVMAAHIRRAFHAYAETLQRAPSNDPA